MLLNVYLDINENYQNKAKYVFKTLLGFLSYDIRFVENSEIKENSIKSDKIDTNDFDIHIHYGCGINKKAKINIYHNHDAANFFCQKKIYTRDDISYVQYKDIKLPFLFGTN